MKKLNLRRFTYYISKLTYPIVAAVAATGLTFAVLKNAEYNRLCQLNNKISHVLENTSEPSPKEMIKAYRERISVLENELKTALAYEKRYSELGKEYENLKQENENLEAQLVRKDKRIEELNKRVKEQKSKIKKLAKEKGALENIIAKNASEILSHVLSSKLKILYQNFKPQIEDPEKIYQIAKKLIERVYLSKEIIKEFLDKIDFSKNSPKNTGIFISALVNHLNGSIELDLTKGPPLDYLGMFLHRDVFLKIKGDVGDYLGYKLNGGRIFVTGASGNFIGYKMRNGTIAVNKAGDYIGCKARRGIITIKTVAGKEVGFDCGYWYDFFQRPLTIRIGESAKSIAWDSSMKITCNSEDVSRSKAGVFLLTVLLPFMLGFSAAGLARRFLDSFYDEYEEVFAYGALGGVISSLATQLYYWFGW